LIPARFASTRLPGKALKSIGGKPMIQWVYERCVLSRSLDLVCVATDDPRIARVIDQCGGKTIMTSPDHASGTDRLAEAVGSIEADIVVNIQGDQPFLDPRMIDEVTGPLHSDPSLPMSTLMHPILRPEDLMDPAVVKVVADLTGRAMYFSRSRIPYPHKDVAHAVYEHIGLYAYRRDFLLTIAGLEPTPLERVESLEQLRVLEHGHTIRVVETACQQNEISGFSVDTEEDLVRAEAMLREVGLS
jgi:3-deoxy-manno-octulosonate cytidylyltransferase (CMP-KDO synthetase)